MELYLNEELVFRNVQAKTDSEVLAFLASEMYKKNYVKEEYIQAIQEREKELPYWITINTTRNRNSPCKL